MPRSKSKVGMSSAGGQTQIAISERDWERIEAKYGHPIPGHLRVKIQQATQAFSLSATCEVNAAPVVDARKAAKTLLSAGKAFQRAITEPTKMDGRFYAFHLVRNYIRDDRLGDHIAFPGPIANLSSVLSSFVTACEKSLAELRDPGRAEIMVGEAWSAWICELTTLLGASALPTSARKDTDKRPGPSPFEVLVEQLQSLVPQSCRRRGSLSGPIGRARARLGAQRSAISGQ